MGFLDWLKPPKSNVEELDDFIWLTAAAKGRGVVKSVDEALAWANAPTVVLVVAHFEACLEEMRQLLEASGISDSRVFALRADDLQRVEDSLLKLREDQFVEMIVAERHPLLHHDDALVEFARLCRCRLRIIHHLSLEDPLLKVFASDWVHSVLERLGMQEDEPIQSRMVSRRIRMAQEKITRHVSHERDAVSAEEWFERNG